MTEYEFRSLKPGKLLLYYNSPLIVCHIIDEDTTVKAVLQLWNDTPGEQIFLYPQYTASCLQLLKTGPTLPDPPSRLYKLERKENRYLATKEVCDYMNLVANYRNAIAFCADL